MKTLLASVWNWTFQNLLYELSPWSQEPGGLSSTLNETFDHHHWFKTGGAWGAGMLRKSSCIESGHDSELSVHPLKDPTADLHELHNLSLLIYESKKWQNFLWLPVWLECCCVPSYRTSLNQGWTVYTKGQRIYHSLCFCYICGLAKWLQFQKALHKRGLTNTRAGEMLYLYSKGLPWGVSSLAAATLTVCLIKQVPGEQASSCTCTSSCTRTDLGTTREVLGES